MRKIIYAVLLSISFLGYGISGFGQTYTDSITKIDSVRSSANSVSVITKEKEAVLMPVSNFSKLLEGRIPGLQATNGGGQPGSSADVLIRGMGNIYGSAAPLIILDGSPYMGDYNAINPHDIATITIKKDAAATIRYGGRATDGIIEIKTKKGNPDDKPKLTIDARVGVVTRALPDYKTIRNEKDYYEISWEAYRNDLARWSGFSYSEAGRVASGNGVTPGIVDLLGYNSYNVENSKLLDPETGKLNPNATLKYSDGDWRKAMQRNGLRHEYNAAFSGGGRKGSYYVSGGYLNEEGYVKRSGYERFTGSFGGDLKPLRWLQAGVHLSAASDDQQYIPTSYREENPFYTSRAFAPIYPVHYYNADGTREMDPITGKDKYDWGNIIQEPASSMGIRTFIPGNNTIGLLELDQSTLKKKNFIATPFVEATVLKQFKIRTQLHYNQLKQEDISRRNPHYGGAAMVGGVKTDYESTLKTGTFTQSLTWQKLLGKHSFEIQTGYENFRYNSEENSNSVTGNSPVPSFFYSKTNTATQSYFGTFNYNFAGKYFLESGFRTNSLEPKLQTNDWNNCWSAGVAWLISQEQFMKDMDWLDELKVKSSYGKQGNFNAATGFIADHAYTSNLNIGLALSLFNNRLFVSSDYFVRESKNVWIAVPNPPSAGITNPAYNSLDLRNNGVEVQLRTNIIRQKNLDWEVTLNLTSHKNEITRMPTGFDSLMTTNKSLLKKGNSYYNFYLPESAGVDPTNGDELYYYINSSGDRKVTNRYDSAYWKGHKNQGNSIPKLYGSLINDISYKNFSFSFMFTFGIGGKYYDQIYAELMNSSTIGQNYAIDILDRWTPENRNATIPRVEARNTIMTQPSSRFLTSASYLNWRNVSLAYTIKKEHLKKIKLKSLKIYVAGDNIMLFSARKGMDPQATFNGMPGYVYSPARTLIFGLNVGL